MHCAVLGASFENVTLVDVGGSQIMELKDGSQEGQGIL
jgi:hypothetical protein